MSTDPGAVQERAAILGRETKVLIFDLYGTVVDMQAGLTQAATPYLEEKGWDGAPHRFVTWWRRTHFENSMIDSLCDRGHTSYREISHRALSYVMDRCGFPYTQEEVVRLVSQIETLKPFPEVPAALERLRRRGLRCSPSFPTAIVTCWRPRCRTSASPSTM